MYSFENSTERTLSFEEFAGFSSGTGSPTFTPEGSEFGTRRDVRNVSLGFGYSLPRSEAEMDTVSYDAFMADTQRKRRRVDDLLSEGDEGVESRTVPKKSASKKVKRGLRELCEIVGREGLGLIKYRDLADRFRCDMSLLEILQLLPDARRGLHKIGMPITKPRQKKKDSQNVPASRTASPALGSQPNTDSRKSASLVEKGSHESGSSRKSVSFVGKVSHEPGHSRKSVSLAERDSREMDNSKDQFPLLSRKNSESSLKATIPIGPDLHPDDKAFKIPVTFRVRHQGKYTKVSMPIGMTHGDQGSDMNLISEPLRKAMGFPIITLSSKG